MTISTHIAARLALAWLGSAAFTAPVVAAPAPSAAVPYTIVDSERWTLASAVSGRTYRIAVYKPSGPAPKDGFPVLFTTDADIFFPVATGSMLNRRLGELRPAIIVGISYPTDDPMAIVRLRTRDLTPNPMADDVLKQMQPYGLTAADAGGAELFYRFITEELRPILAARYPVNAADETLFGHSLGGLFVLHVLFNHPAAFRNYVAASPSIAWSDGAILADVPGFKTKLEALATPPNVLMLVGGRESDPDAMPVGAMPKAEAAAMMAKSPMVGNMLALATRLRSTADGPALAVESYVIPGENHVSVQPASIARAMTFTLANPTWGKPCVAPCTAAPAQ